jgi:hypothetical protein
MRWNAAPIHPSSEGPTSLVKKPYDLREWAITSSIACLEKFDRQWNAVGCQIEQDRRIQNDEPFLKRRTSPNPDLVTKCGCRRDTETSKAPRRHAPMSGILGHSTQPQSKISRPNATFHNLLIVRRSQRVQQKKFVAER